jgi:hypothetical protein
MSMENDFSQPKFLLAQLFPARELRGLAVWPGRPNRINL